MKWSWLGNCNPQSTLCLLGSLIGFAEQSGRLTCPYQNGNNGVNALDHAGPQVISCLNQQEPADARDHQAMVAWCWASVADAGPTSSRHWLNMSCPHQLLCEHWFNVGPIYRRLTWLSQRLFEVWFTRSCPVSNLHLIRPSLACHFPGSSRCIWQLLRRFSECQC